MSGERVGWELKVGGPKLRCSTTSASASSPKKNGEYKWQVLEREKNAWEEDRSSLATGFGQLENFCTSWVFEKGNMWE